MLLDIVPAKIGQEAEFTQLGSGPAGFYGQSPIYKKLLILWKKSLKFIFKDGDHALSCYRDRVCALFRDGRSRDPRPSQSSR